MSAASRQIWISVTTAIVVPMTMLGMVGWGGGHPHPYYWAIVVMLIVSCVLGCMKLRPKQDGQRASRGIRDGSPEPQRTTQTKGA